MSANNRIALNSSSLSSSSVMLPMGNSGLFATQQPSPGEKELQQRHYELNSYIQVLDEKVKKMVESNEAELLLAYKNHIHKVRKDIQEFKDETAKAMKKDPSHAEKVDMLEKQLIIFREEALRLFEKLVQKDRLIQQLTMEKAEVAQANQHLSKTVKRLMHQNKLLQREHAEAKPGHSTTFERERLHTTQERPSTQQQAHKHILTEESEPEVIRPNTTTFFMKRRVASTKAEADSPHQRFRATHYQKNPQHDISFQRTGYSIHAKMVQNSQKSMKQSRWLGVPSRTASAATREKSEQVIEEELKEVFGRCVWTMKKEIARRKKTNTLNFYKEGSPITLEEFKQMDIQRLIDMVFASQQLTQLLYQKLVLGRAQDPKT